MSAEVTSAATDGSRPLRRDIAVVIPTVGRAILRRSLSALAAGDELPGKVIVVDQSSNPGIREWLRELETLGVETSHLLSSETGRAAAVNRGIEQADTEFLAITDDDCLVAEDWLRNMHTHLQANPGAVITGRVEAAGDEDVPMVVTSMSPAAYNWPRLKFDSLSGGNMGVALAVMTRVGLLDEDTALRCAEDGEWAYRALRAGVPIRFEPDVLVHHHGWRDSAARAEQYRQYARSCGGFFGKYLRRGDWFIGLRAIVHYLREVRRLVRAGIGRNGEELRMSWACLRWLVPGMIAGFRSESARRGSREGRNR